MRASGLSLEGRCTLVENVCYFEIIPSPRERSGFSPYTVISWQALTAHIEDGESNAQRMVRISLLSERRYIAGKGGHSAGPPKTICILILITDSARYHGIIECERAQFWYNSVIKRKIEARRLEYWKKKRSREREKKKEKLSAPAVSNLHWEAPILKVQARYWRGTRLQNAEISVYIPH